jgi:hypothetical protein
LAASVAPAFRGGDAEAQQPARKRYGFVDTFNPHTGWVAPEAIGIGAGITLLMTEKAPWLGHSVEKRKSPQRSRHRGLEIGRCCAQSEESSW